MNPHQFKDKSAEKAEEPDYSFSKEIQEALKAGDTVWMNYAGTGWEEIWIDKEDDYNVREMIESKWALEKPKVKKKKLERWANILTNGHMHCHPSEQAAKDGVMPQHKYKAVAVPFCVDYEEEE